MLNISSILSKLLFTNTILAEFVAISVPLLTDTPIVDAVREIYLSDIYKQLEDESTKMWHLGPVALYQGLTAGV